MYSVDYYMTLPYKMMMSHDSEEGGYVAFFPELPGCITCAETLEEATENAKDAKRAWLEAAIECGIEICTPALANN